MKNKTVCVVGLGYVGLPLAEAFSKHLRVIGFDIDKATKNAYAISSRNYWEELEERSNSSLRINSLSRRNRRSDIFFFIEIGIFDPPAICAVMTL